MVSGLISFKRRFPWLWRRVESVNGTLFRIFHRDVDKVVPEVLEDAAPEGLAFSLATVEDAPSLAGFLNSQPEDSFQYFRPHLFDEKSLARIIKGNSFIVMKVTEGEIIRGYFFLRCFFSGRAFAGLLVDSELRNQGIGTAIWSACARICDRLGIRMFATIDEKNLPSLKSCDAGTEVVARERLSKEYIMVECEMRKQINKTTPVL